MPVEYCNKCDYPTAHCQCDALAAQEKRRAETIRKARYKADCARMGGPRAVAEFTLDKYRNKVAIENCAGYPKQGLFLFGPTGCGKTHLATALVRKYENGRVVKPTDILRKMRACEKATQEEALIDSYASGALVIDDLGIEKTTEFAATTLYEIFDRRWMTDPSGLIVTSNVGMNDLAKKIGDDRIISRIAGMCKTVKIEGADGRLK
jgi:DNA replication protein DnaC